MPFLLIAAIAALGLGVWLIMRDPAAIAERELALGIHSVGGRFQGPPMKYAIEGEPDPLPWCGRFARYCADQAHKPLPGNRFLIPSVSELERALSLAGALLPPDEEPRRGDLILLRGTGAGDPDELGLGDRHVGVVVAVDETFVHSIDGDYGTPDGVRQVRRERGQSNISGFGRW